MIYGYIRVSTDKQNINNQKFEILNFCNKENLHIDKWINETICGVTDLNKRKLGYLLDVLKSGDILITSELSRLGRNLLQVMSILNICMNKDIQVWTIKDNYRLGKDIQSKVLAFAFGLSAEIERNLISQRTKEALKRVKNEGKKLGRPLGVKNNKLKLSGNEDAISKMLECKIPLTYIAKTFGVNRTTLSKFIREKL
ncbi:MAG: master DNA invertase Mpi family serine-type recombinase [Alphaproteobacteria bacterium]|nr:master DNA invertase Mpi family serine-type recombinase [Alphaproteobacteria bacterium]